MARAIVRAAEERNLQHEEEHAEVEYIVAHGISSMLNGEKALLEARTLSLTTEGIVITDSQKKQIEKTRRELFDGLSCYRRKIMRRFVHRGSD